ncbi:GPR1/FUN34/YaaH family transporter [Streptomyces sp900105245]|uniref:GPR1/FUN34/YaaH family transporter n=3 Tax=Streptomyces TaxID=1883 RepID=A0ABV1U0X7_9ACTN|nr:GPR1/FUN34/YaaH family transporter [Streptomyces sp. HUAS 14-6]UXY39325.1 GPR1/FUN34/YaaH family transporter [Streptomyces sp. HUAS 14-6]
MSPAARTYDTAGGPPRPEALTRIMLRPLASSLPLGFFAFGTGSVLLSATQLHWVPLDQTRPLMLLVLVFVVPLQLLAGIFAFLARDGGAATALSVLGCTWAGTALVTLSGPPGQRSPAMAVFLLSVAPLMLVLCVAALRGKPLFGVLLLIGAGRFVLTGVYDAGGGAVLLAAAGWTGVALASFALYGGLALLLEDGAQRTVLPLGRRGRARTSLQGDLGHQLDQAEREAGVRRQL